ncbi:DUF2235 domain-containing protein [Paracoccus methylarcula]|uniref:DUF2235 domain-containing protein n=1 Tax=Paracoccus methylarcula TaxID=72022 RepID=A0A422QZ26_9RHOB|nr:DUF2235 domain-containing protein [Paracoccus methylarcula]RNF35211.1 DUF2235 domain-containing protein [Paracoccus methylarcula]
MRTIRSNLIHVILIDGTFASLDDGKRSSIGRVHALLRGRYGPLKHGRLRIHYASGQQWNSWRTVPELMMGQGLSMRIIEAYAWLAKGYRPGDQVFLLGYSRGGFAIRSLAGMIGRVGLLRPEYASSRNVRLAWRYYSEGTKSRQLEIFHRRRSQVNVPIRMVGCFDTVMALGIRLPLLWILTEPRFRFHDTHLGDDVEHGFQALALNENRAAFAPILWDNNSTAGQIEQMWFQGAHADIGGQLSGLEFARPLANIPLVWMLDRAESVGLPLPEGWRDHFTRDASAPSVGSWRNWGKAFLARASRVAGQYETEKLHETVPRPYPGPAKLTGSLADQAGAGNGRKPSTGQEAIAAEDPPGLGRAETS